MKHLILSILTIFLCGNFTLQAQTNDLSEEDKKEFQIQVKQKIDEMQQYFAFIADKNETPANKDVYIKQTLKLFIGDGKAYYDVDGTYYPAANIQTSSVRTGKISTQTVANYLYRLRNLPYTQVLISSSEACKITNIHQEADGRYSCVAIFYQDFYGYRDGRVVYSDRVTKRTKVYLERFLIYDSNGDADKYKYRVKLGNTTVSETRRIN